MLWCKLFLKSLPFALPSDKKKAKHMLHFIKQGSAMKEEFGTPAPCKKKHQLLIRSNVLLSYDFLCFINYRKQCTGYLLRVNIFTFRPPLSSGNIGTFKDCLLLEQGKDDLLFSLFLSLSTCMHADASNRTSSVSKRKQIKIMFSLFCFPKLWLINWHLSYKSHVISNWSTSQRQSRWIPKTFFLDPSPTPSPHTMSCSLTITSLKVFII